MLEQIARSMRVRMPWAVAQTLFKLNNVPKGHGWDRTVEKIAANASSLGTTADPLTEALTQHVLAGEKLVELYRVDREELAQLREAISELEVPEGALAAEYPRTLSEMALAGEAAMQPQVVAIERRDDGQAVVFSSIRILEFREPLDVSEFPEEVTSYLLRFSSVVGLRRVPTQFFQVVWVPHDGDIVQLRSDYLEGMTLEDAQSGKAMLREACNAQFGGRALSTPLNLFGAINAIYANPEEGHVVEMHFTTSTSSVKQERMRRSGLSLRDELYHVAGKAALEAPIEPYKISVSWDFPLGQEASTRPELTLSSTARMAGSSNPYLYEASITGCIGLADYSFVLDRLLAHVPPDEDA